MANENREFRQRCLYLLRTVEEAIRSHDIEIIKRTEKKSNRRVLTNATIFLARPCLTYLATASIVRDSSVWGGTLSSMGVELS